MFLSLSSCPSCMMLYTFLAAQLFASASAGECDASSALQRIGAVFERVPQCEIADLNAGLCVGKNKCHKCNLTENVLPTNATGFPGGKLLCAGDDGTTCSLIDNTQQIIFKNFNDYLECAGQSVCSDFWNVQNAGAACCLSSSSPDKFKTKLARVPRSP